MLSAEIIGLKVVDKNMLQVMFALLTLLIVFRILSIIGTTLFYRLHQLSFLHMLIIYSLSEREREQQYTCKKLCLPYLHL